MEAKAPNKKLQSTLLDLQTALSEWDSIPNEESKTAEGVIESTEDLERKSDIKRKTQELLKQLNEQIKDLGL